MSENAKPNNIIKIPEEATLKELIELLNFLELTIHADSKDPDFQKWLYNHQNWITNGGE